MSNHLTQTATLRQNLGHPVTVAILTAEWLSLSGILNAIVWDDDGDQVAGVYIIEGVETDTGFQPSVGAGTFVPYHAIAAIRRNLERKQP